MGEQEKKREPISVCGTDCSACGCFGQMCNGCNACEGKVFHAPKGQACPIYDCVKNTKSMQHCGQCGEVPCKIEVCMANNKELVDYIMEQLAGLGEIRHIPMMGGYIFYYRERIFGGIYGNGFLVKITEASKKYMPDSEPEPPYEGAKPMLPVTILEDRDALQAMVREMYPELPERKPKKKK